MDCSGKGRRGRRGVVGDKGVGRNGEVLRDGSFKEIKW
jgi:hypothetical protein